MELKIYRCGWCGYPTDKDGNCVQDPDELDLIMNIVALEGTDKRTHLTNGECCIAEVMRQEEESRVIQITRDMALDACDPTLEGQWIRY